MTIHSQQLTRPENDNGQQFGSPATTSSLGVYLCDRSGQRGQVWPSTRLGQSKRDRTEQAIFSNPLWLNAPFSHQWPWNCSVSLHERHPDGTVGSKPSKRIGGSPGRGGGRETWVNKWHARAQRSHWEHLQRSAWVCLVEIRLTCVRTAPTHHDDIHLVYCTQICFCLLKSYSDGVGSKVVVSSALDGVRDPPLTLPCARLATGCDLAQQVSQLSDSPQVLFTTGGSQGQRTWLYFKFRLQVPGAKLLRTHCLVCYDDCWGGWPGIMAETVNSILYDFFFFFYSAAWQKSLSTAETLSLLCSSGLSVSHVLAMLYVCNLHCKYVLYLCILLLAPTLLGYTKINESLNYNKL